jgi:hypothetical protein
LGKIAEILRLIAWHGICYKGYRETLTVLKKTKEIFMATVTLVDTPNEEQKKAGIDYIGGCGPNDELLYPGINSCLTVTAIFEDGSRTGVHLVIVDAKPEWKERLNAWKDLTKGKGTPKKIIIVGSIDVWEGSNYLTSVIELIKENFKSNGVELIEYEDFTPNFGTIDIKINNYGIVEIIVGTASDIKNEENDSIKREIL